ncbi:cache domain-containing sensor histidine kinase [Paenibacillus prosopidis]|uniref:histidine kinase n=1 Tax=Paenibacillus prosopidis TaxID=630520 RepID=A0A368W5F2_9BACL|nr:histidine kinase [Paenibacillus prosopidis]RCW49494.1 two-component system sensor histidine kinase YesM [Paenibacillus prosopidis]
MWTSWGKKVSFKSKLLIGISAIIFFTVNLTGLISYQTHLRLFEEEVTGQYLKASEQAMMQLELRIQEMYRVSNYIVFNRTIERIITKLSNARQELSFAERYFEQEQIAEQLRQVKFDAPQLLSLYLYDLTGRNYYYSLLKETVEPLSQADFHDVHSTVASSNGDLVWMQRSIPSQIEKSGYRDVIIASRWMKASHGENYGLLVMVIDEEFLTRSFREIGSGDDGRVYLYDQQAKLLYTDGPEEDTEGIKRLLTGTNNSKIKEGDTIFFYTSVYSKEILFTLISRVSLSYIFRESQLILNISLWLGLLSIGLSGLLITLLSGRLLSPLRELVRAMRTMREGNFDIRIRSRTYDELGFLGESFNSMASSVQDMIQKVYVSQIREREAELKALQAQLNPHFLYNTLNGLYWKLYLQNDLDSANLVFSLSKLLKYSLERIKKRTTLREELEQVENYLRIQSAFLENSFDARIHADEDVYDCDIQRLLLQPLVENAFVHAFKERTSSKVLEIRAYRIDDFLKIEIEDNGCGMSKEQVEGICAPDFTGERDSLGVQSVLRRINLVYGPPYRLEITSSAGQGTTVHLYLPLRGDEQR